MAGIYKETRLLVPYMWQNKCHGQARKKVRKNDIVFITKLNCLGQVSKLAETQLKIIFRDVQGKLHQDWFPKKDLTLVVGCTTDQAGLAQGLESRDG